MNHLEGCRFLRQTVRGEFFTADGVDLHRTRQNPSQTDWNPYFLKHVRLSYFLSYFCFDDLLF